MIVRDGEGRNAWFRSERFFDTNEGWFFVTRENTQQGPFLSSHDAADGLEKYIRSINDRDILTGL